MVVETRMEMQNIYKSFPGVQALDNVSIKVKPGEVHALLGENGAGKSTLIKILGGIYKMDSGRILYNGEEVRISDVASARRLGISVVHQELCLAANLTVGENIFVGRIPVRKPLPFINRKSMNEEAHRLCTDFGLDIHPNTQVNSLTIAQQQMVELAKAMSQNVNLVVLDEPTATLTNEEIKRLFSLVKSMKMRGVSFIYISHRLEEVFEIADTASILRDGRFVAYDEVANLNYNRLVSLLVGRELTDYFAKPNAVKDEVILEAKNISIGNRVKDVSFNLKKGEVLGFYGLVGSGRTELMRGICGIDSIDSGEITFKGNKINIKSPGNAIDIGIGLVPENRKEEGLVLINSVAFNTTISIWKKIIRGFRVKKKKEKMIVEEYVQKMAIKTPSYETWVGSLSGGNQQKVVVAKTLAAKPQILIMDEPTRGIDVGAKKEIYHIIKGLAEEGISIIMISSEMPEIINMSNRIMVMCEGRINGELQENEISESNIIICATGGTI